MERGGIEVGRRFRVKKVDVDRPPIFSEGGIRNLLGEGHFEGNMRSAGEVVVMCIGGRGVGGVKRY